MARAGQHAAHRTAEELGAGEHRFGRRDMVFARRQFVDRDGHRGEIELLAQGEQPCQAFDDYAPKTNISHHLARLREAGVTRTRIDRSYRRISVRLGDLAARFPGLLDAIAAAARRQAAEPRD